MTKDQIPGSFAVKNLNELRQASQEHRDMAMSLIQKAKKENRNMTSDEVKQYNLANECIELLSVEIEAAQKLEAQKQAEARAYMHTSSPEKSDAKQASEFRYSDGRPVEVYTRDHAPQRAAGSFRNIGEYVKAIVTGTQNEAQRRDLQSLSGSGSYGIPLNIQQGVIDKLRSQLVLTQAGAKILNLEPGVTRIVKVTADASPIWHQQNADISPADGTFVGVDITPKTILSLAKISRELFTDSVNIEQAISKSMIGAIRAGLEEAAFTGTGSTAYMPTGLENVSGVSSYYSSTAGAALSSWSELIALDYKLRSANANMSGLITSPGGYAAIMSLVTDSEKNPLMRPPNLANMPIYSTPAISETQTRGASTACTSIWGGDWTQLIIAVLQDARIEVFKELFRGSDSIGIMCSMRVDIQPLWPAAFARLGGVLPNLTTLLTT